MSNLPIIQHPTFSVTLPLTKKSVIFRPFLVKEHKILMIAQESGTKEALYQAVRQIATNCTFGQHKVETWPLAELMYFFTRLRAKSVGETIEFSLACANCKNEHKSSINFEKLDIVADPEHVSKIEMTDKIGIVMKEPDMMIDKILKTDMTPQQMEIAFIRYCIDYVYDETQTYKASEAEPGEVDALLENLTAQTYQKLQKFVQTIPTISYKHEYTCTKCQHPNSLVLTEFSDFFG